MTRAVRLASIYIALAAAGVGEALAHASGRGFVLLLPTEAMQVGGALAVAVSFLLLIFLPARAVRAIFRTWPVADMPTARISTLTSLASLGFWIALVAIGFVGARDPTANPLPLTVWTLVWIVLPLSCAVFGNLWHFLNPWSGVIRLFGLREPLVALPAKIGYAPAILGLLAFGWFEIVDLAPDDPARLARAVTIYWIITFAAMSVFGERAWLERGEFLNVFLGFIARLAPVRVAQDQIRLSIPGAGLIAAPTPSLSGALFILCALATVSFDGLSETWWWLAHLGINPLEFPGRSAVTMQNTGGLLAACALLTIAFVGCLAIGLRGTTIDWRDAIGRFSLSILPISLAYHFAHYLTALLVNGQYVIAAATDPLATGADWLGLGQFYVTTSFLNVQESVETIWRAQSGAIILGHILAVCVAHRIALDLWPDTRRATTGQVPLAALMVAYTVFGLWLLASPTA